MKELEIDLLNMASHFLTVIIGVVLGRIYEKKKQSLAVRSEMLKPIEEWLAGAERVIGVFSDTFVSISLNSTSPITYDFDQRREITQFMQEKTNAVLGILNSKSLQTRKTRKMVFELNKNIAELDQLIKYQLLPLDLEISSTPRNISLSPDLMNRANKMKVKLDSCLIMAHSLISKIRLNLI